MRTSLPVALITTAFVLLSAPAFAEDAAPAMQQPPQTPVSLGSSGAAGSNLMNPAISLDGLFTFSQFNNDNPLVFVGGHDPKQNGFNLQQVELTMGANVDPYFRADANIVFTLDGVEVEEAYATTLDLPYNLQARAGQFLTLFGRQNPTHPHAWDFTNMPLVSGRMFGGDGLRGPGAQLSWLTPLPFFSELIVSAQNSNGSTTPSFLNDSGTKMRTIYDGVVMFRTNNFFELTDDLSANIGYSYLMGANPQAFPNSRTHIMGGDLYMRYRKPSSLSFITLTSEIMRRSYDMNASGNSDNDWGWYAQLVYRLGEPLERWFVGLRYDWVSAKSLPVYTSTNPITQTISGTVTNIGDRDSSQRFRISPDITFYPSEFSKLRIQYSYDKPQDWAHAQQVVDLQIEFLIGSHGAHKF